MPLDEHKVNVMLTKVIRKYVEHENCMVYHSRVEYNNGKLSNSLYLHLRRDNKKKVIGKLKQMPMRNKE